jgi:hypothetical protein
MKTSETGLQRLTSDMLTQCAAQLRSVTDERDELKCDNAILLVRLRLMECRYAKLLRARTS